MARYFLALGSVLLLFGVYLRTLPGQSVGNTAALERTIVPAATDQEITATSTEAPTTSAEKAVDAQNSNPPQPLADQPRTVVWQDTFDAVSAGWQPQSRLDPTGANSDSFSRVANGAYEFHLDATDKFVRWNINNLLTVPPYPYVVDVDARVVRQQLGLLVLDFHGDPANIDTGAGLYVTFGLSASYPETLFADPLWANYGLEPTGANVQVFENTSGISWQLPCSEAYGLPMSRTTRISAYVSEYSLVVALTAADTGKSSWISCQRIQNRQIMPQGNIGVGVVPYTFQAPSPVFDVIAYDAISISTIPALPTTMKADGSPRQIDTTACFDETLTSFVSDEIEYRVGKHVDICVGGDVAPDAQLVVRYPSEINDFVTSWQCGIDPENRLELRWNGTHIIAVFASGESYELLAVKTIMNGPTALRFELLPLSGDYFIQALRPGDTYQEPYPHQLYIQDDIFVSNWAGPCTRQS